MVLLEDIDIFTNVSISYFFAKYFSVSSLSAPAVLWIRDVYTASQISHPDFFPSRISDPTKKEQRKNNLVVLPLGVEIFFFNR
jgi:hypothetical protein